MFNCYEFTFDGVSSEMYGLMVYDIGGRGQEDVSFANKASITESRTRGRVRPIWLDVDYGEEPLSFSLVFGAEKPLDRFDMESISFWLTGHKEYKWLSIGQPDLEHVQYRCLITELTPISVGWLPVAFRAVVRCDCPYAYGYPFVREYTISGETSVLFRNESSVHEYLKPTLSFTPASGVTALSVVNREDRNRELSLTGLPAGAKVSMDNENGILMEENAGGNLYDGFNMNFFRLVPGDNHLTIVGNGTLTISGRFLHNVGA